MPLMKLPWRAISVSSLVLSYVLVLREREWPALSLAGAYATLWMFQSFLWVTWIIILYPKFFSPFRGLPEPSGGSFLNGHFSKIAAEPTGIPMREWVATIPNDGLIRYLGLLNMERLLITSSKALSEVLVTKNYDFEKPKVLRSSIGRILGVGVLLAEGEQHKVQRRNLNPAFAFRHIKNLYPVFWRKGREATEAITQTILSSDDRQTESSSEDPEKATGPSPAGSAALEISQWASRATLDIIGVAGLGRDFGAIQDPENELNQTYQRLFKPSSQARLLAFLGLVLPQKLLNILPVQRNSQISQAAQTIRSVCQDLIKTKREKLARKELTDTDILSVALESGGFTDEGLINQLMTFLAAGHDTTASALTWSIYMLSRYPDVQTRLRQEIREHLPSISDTEKDISNADIDRLPYLNAVCNEVLRYYSPVPLTTREAVVDTSIQGQHVPKGTRIMIVPWATHFDKTLWGPDADKFNPERWIATDEHDKHASSGGATSNYAFLTFLHGPRSCIGSGFARAEFACLLAAWIGRFEFELRDKEMEDETKLEIKSGVTARPARGLWVKARVVEGW